MKPWTVWFSYIFTASRPLNYEYLHVLLQYVLRTTCIIDPKNVACLHFDGMLRFKFTNTAKKKRAFSYPPETQRSPKLPRLLGALLIRLLHSIGISKGASFHRSILESLLQKFIFDKWNIRPITSNWYLKGIKNASGTFYDHRLGSIIVFHSFWTERNARKSAKSWESSFGVKIA